MRGLAILLLTLGLVACDGEDPITSATRDVATANHAAAAVARTKAEDDARAVGRTGTVEADAPAPASCDVEVSFGSFGAGVDTALRAQILTLTRDNPDVSASTEDSWGREGETTLCLRARDMAAANRLYGLIAAQLPTTSTRAPTTVRHSDGRSRAVAYPSAR